MTEKCGRCGFPLNKTYSYVVMNDKMYCITCYLKITSFKYISGEKR